MSEKPTPHRKPLILRGRMFFIDDATPMRFSFLMVGIRDLPHPENHTMNPALSVAIIAIVLIAMFMFITYDSSDREL